ncbi:MAG: hypothetical protein E7812_05130 [Phenylobacterium sp.]|nr:MAG: hypothetical protein E7812_05130 [Phenylobacterium sp.]
MILQISHDAPLLVRAGAATLLFLHVGGATGGLISGTVSMAARKGGRLHRISGNIFFVSMLIMSGIGAVVAPFLPDIGSTFGGLLTFYLVATAWLTVMRPSGSVGVLDVGAFLVPVATAAAGLWLGWLGAQNADGMVGSLPYQVPIVVALIALLAAGLDLRVILKGGVWGAHRTARHLWRMCLGMFVAVGSLAGQPMALPPVLRGSPLMLIPMLLVLALMVFWLVRTLSPRRAKSPARPATQAAATATLSRAA